MCVTWSSTRLLHRFIAVIRRASAKGHPRIERGGWLVSATQQACSTWKLAIARGCTGLIEEMGGYVWDEKKAQRTGEEAPVKVGDHGPDALRYGAFTHIRRYERRYGIMLSREAA